MTAAVIVSLCAVASIAYCAWTIYHAKREMRRYDAALAAVQQLLDEGVDPLFIIRLIPQLYGCRDEPGLEAP